MKPGLSPCSPENMTVIHAVGPVGPLGDPELKALDRGRRFHQGAQGRDGCGLQATSDGPEPGDWLSHTLGTSPPQLGTALSQRGAR